MISDELTTFVRSELAAGVSKEKIRVLLRQNGWSEREISAAFPQEASHAKPYRTPAVASRPTYTARKLALSIGLLLASVAYAAWASFDQKEPALAPLSAASSLVEAGATSNAQAQAVSDPPAAPMPSATAVQSPEPASTPKPKPAGKYADGTYTGSVADAYYGNVQVRAVVQNGRLADVQFLQYPNDRSTSRRINGYATPQLRSEAIYAQTAHVDVVSGATDTSEAFVQSLSSALSQAKA